jgi:hypothetical protein
MCFKEIRIVKIPIPDSSNYLIFLYLTDIKYYLSIGLFNLISVSQIFKEKKAQPILIKEAIY